MVKSEELEFIRLLYIGIVAMLLLAIAVVLFVILHQRRAYLLQAHLRQQEQDYQVSMLQAVLASQESERERIAHDLHDEIGASLSAARLFINQVRHEITIPHLRDMSQQAGQILGDTLQNVRYIVQNLSSTLLAHYGFCQAVAIQAARLEATGLKVDIQLHEAAELLEASTQLVLYRIIQELLANIAKHARASHILLHLRADATSLTLVATDDGCGFITDLPKTATASMGLAGIRARAQLLSGHLEFISAPGCGTHVTLTLPRQLAAKMV